MIREIQIGDYDRLKYIHEKYYKHEFEFPDFLNHFLCAFTIIGDDGDIVLTGGIRTIVECVALTDKNKSPFIRRKALVELMAASQYVMDRSGYDEMHAFVQDDKWLDQLKRSGFRNTRGQSIVLGF